MSGIQITRGTIPGTITVSGYLTEFREYDLPAYESWRETIDRDAATRAVAARPTVRLLIDGRGIPVARTSNGTLNLSVDVVGLKMTAVLLESDPEVRRLRGGEDITWGCKPTSDEWSPDRSQRTITGLSLHGCDISIDT